MKDVFGLKVEHEQKLQQIEEALLEAIAPPEERSPQKTEAGNGRRRVVPVFSSSINGEPLVVRRVDDGLTCRFSVRSRRLAG